MAQHTRLVRCTIAFHLPLGPTLFPNQFRLLLGVKSLSSPFSNNVQHALALILHATKWWGHGLSKMSGSDGRPVTTLHLLALTIVAAVAVSAAR